MKIKLNIICIKNINNGCPHLNIFWQTNILTNKNVNVEDILNILEFRFMNLATLKNPEKQV